MIQRKNRLTAEAYVDGIINGNRIVLSRAITLIESRLPIDQEVAQKVLQQVLPYTGKSLRIGITGVPGVGKSTFIEVFGKFVTSLSKKLAVLAIDPSSQRSKGSIMGDKTRMETLVNDPFAYIRPSPTGNSLGGVTRNTRQAMLLCEAAGYEIIFIETVGVGQSETAVHSMVDFFLLLMLAGAGDELQGIKKGIMEMAHGIAITKADGANRVPAKTAQVAYQNALHLFPPAESGWYPQVLTCSSVTREGIAEIWSLIQNYYLHTQQNGYFKKKRQEQHLQWMHETIKQSLEEQFYQNPQIQALLPQIETSVKHGEIPALTAALQLLEIFRTRS